MALILVINSEKFRKMVGFGLVFLLVWTPQAGRATRQCPHDATSGGKEATDCRCRHHGESESSGRSSNNPPGIIVFGPLSSSPRMASDPVENRFENFGPTIALGTRPAPNRLPKRSENSHTASSGAAPRLARFWRFYEPPSARYASAQSETAVFGYRR